MQMHAPCSSVARFAVEEQATCRYCGNVPAKRLQHMAFGVGAPCAQILQHATCMSAATGKHPSVVRTGVDSILQHTKQQAKKHTTPKRSSAYLVAHEHAAAKKEIAAGRHCGNVPATRLQHMALSVGPPCAHIHQHATHPLRQANSLMLCGQVWTVCSAHKKQP
jgi:hypothetical protein